MGIKEIIKELQDLKAVIASNQSDYCNTSEAARIMAVSERDLKKLHINYGLPRYQRVKHFVYKKVDCYRFAALMDNQTIVL